MFLPVFVLYDGRILSLMPVLKRDNNSTAQPVQCIAKQKGQNQNCYHIGPSFYAFLHDQSGSNQSEESDASQKTLPSRHKPERKQQAENG